jgi:hypothetical protein
VAAPEKPAHERPIRKAIHIHAEIHEMARKEAFEDRVPIQEVVHRYVCIGAGRKDLILQSPDHVSVGA